MLGLLDYRAKRIQRAKVRSAQAHVGKIRMAHRRCLRYNYTDFFPIQKTIPSCHIEPAIPSLNQKTWFRLLKPTNA